MRGKKKLLAAALAAALTVSLTGCGREIDADAVGAVSVPGANKLKRFCDGPTLIYFSDWNAGTDDDYEWFYPGGCVKNAQGVWVFNETAPDYALPDGEAGDGKDN